MKVRQNGKFVIKCNKCNGWIGIAKKTDKRGQIDLCSDFCRQVYKNIRRRPARR